MKSARSQPLGSGAAALVGPAMRALPVGLPKLLVCTLASGDVRPYVASR